jgi:hypothetical protein
MDPDTAHTFSESSRNTLIATAAVGKSAQSCSFNPPRSPSLSPTWMHCSGSLQTMPLRSHARISGPQLMRIQAVPSYSLS